jgi:hypothetical protein
VPPVDFMESIVRQREFRLVQFDELVPGLNGSFYDLITQGQQRISLKESVIPLAFVVA